MIINLWLPWQPWQRKAFKKLTSPLGLADFEFYDPFFSETRKFKKLIERARNRGWVYVKVPYPMKVFYHQQKEEQEFIHYLRHPNSPDLPILYKAISIFDKVILWGIRFKDKYHKYQIKCDNVLNLIAKGQWESADQLLESIEAEMILEII